MNIKTQFAQLLFWKLEITLNKLVWDLPVKLGVGIYFDLWVCFFIDLLQGNYLKFLSYVQVSMS